MRRSNINAVLKMVKQFLNSEMNTTSFRPVFQSGIFSVRRTFAEFTLTIQVH